MNICIVIRVQYTESMKRTDNGCKVFVYRVHETYRERLGENGQTVQTESGQPDNAPSDQSTARGSQLSFTAQTWISTLVFSLYIYFAFILFLEVNMNTLVELR